LVAEVAATPSRALPNFPNVTLGLGTRRQARPFHRRIRVLKLLLVVVEPTAQALRAEVAATAASELNLAEDGLGLDTRFHAAPFQCTIKVLPLLVEPTAQAFLAEVAATPERPPTGLVTRRHAVPFQCTIRALPPPVEPTAHALRAEIAATP
jgi:hypothetical protein